MYRIAVTWSSVSKPAAALVGAVPVAGTEEETAVDAKEEEEDTTGVAGVPLIRFPASGDVTVAEWNACKGAQDDDDVDDDNDGVGRGVPYPCPPGK